jgi:hypothetical protein
MLKQTVRFACLALLLFAASAAPLIANATIANATSSRFDGPDPYPPMPPTTCAPLPLPCYVGV